MNKWVKKSIGLAGGPRYLDNLFKVYPVGTSGENGRLSKDQAAVIKRLYRSGKFRELLDFLIGLERFPYDEPYIGFLRADPAARTKNPKTVLRVTSTLRRMGERKILEGANKEKSESRKLGQSFRRWVRNEWKSRVYADEGQFLKAEGVAFLDGGDKRLMEFAKKYFGYKRKKGLDFVARAYGVPIVGEAKFISTNGGTQDKSFREAVDFVRKGTGKAVHVAVLDGVVWNRRGGTPVSGRKNLYSSLESLDPKRAVLSALLLRDFLEDFKS